MYCKVVLQQRLKRKMHYRLRRNFCFLLVKRYIIIDITKLTAKKMWTKTVCSIVDGLPSLIKN